MPRVKVDLKNFDYNKQPELWNPKFILQLASAKKLVKGVQSVYDFGGKTVVLTDVSVNSRGPLEDDIFASDVNLHHNIRRGLAVVTQGSEYTIARRGLKKFFDIQQEDLKPGAIPEKGLDRILRHYTLGEVERVINDKPITIYRTEKANGENAQVSYAASYDAWVVSSKNVSILVQHEGQLSSSRFREKRCSFAVLIAKAWFQQIAKLTQQQLEKLKLMLGKGRTFVGEYCGNPEYQHLVFYEDIHIRFFAIVEHDSHDSCIEPKKAYEVFDYFGLPRVKMTETKCETVMDFYQTLRAMFKDVAGKSIEEEGEGAVIYFSDESRVISLAKLKTLEYRLFRKLREKLKTLLTHTDAPSYAPIFKKYLKEAEELTQFCSPAKDMTYYEQVAQAAFGFIHKFATTNKENKLHSMRRFVSSHYIDFLNKIRSLMESNQAITDGAFTQDLERVDQEEDLESDEEAEEDESGGNKQDKLLQKSALPKVVVVMPVTIPGCGKSHLVKSIATRFEESKEGNDNPIHLITLESDLIRKQCIEDYRKLHPGVSNEQAHAKSQGQYLDHWQSAISGLANKIKSSSSSKFLIVIDKNHGAQQLNHSTKQVREALAGCCNLTLCGLVPQCPDKFKPYPFSLNYLLASIRRALSRPDHHTLGGGELFVAAVVCRFFKFFEGAKFSHVFDQIIEMPFLSPDLPQLKEDQAQFLSEFLQNIAKKDPEAIAKEFTSQLDKVIEMARSQPEIYPSSEEQWAPIQKLINKYLQK